jgi:hypothetical protein
MENLMENDCDHDKHIKCMTCMRDLPILDPLLVGIDTPELVPALARIKELEALNGDLGYQKSIMEEVLKTKQKQIDDITLILLEK